MLGQIRMEHEKRNTLVCTRLHYFSVIYAHKCTHTGSRWKFHTLLLCHWLRGRGTGRETGQRVSHHHQHCFLHETDGSVKYSLSKVWPCSIPAFHPYRQGMSFLSQLWLCDLSQSKNHWKKKEKRQILEKNRWKKRIYFFYSYSIVTTAVYITAIGRDTESENETVNQSITQWPPLTILLIGQNTLKIHKKLAPKWIKCGFFSIQCWILTQHSLFGFFLFCRLSSEYWTYCAHCTGGECYCVAAGCVTRQLYANMIAIRNWCIDS